MRDMAYRFYIAEGIRVITQNTAKQCAGNYIEKSYHDILKPPKEEKRTPKEIIDKIKKGLAEL